LIVSQHELIVSRDSEIEELKLLDRTDATRSFGEVEGALNRMSVGRFIRLIEEQQFRIRELH
jgi:hypothetical protein